MAVRSALVRLVPDRTALLVCDVQEKFAPSVKYFNVMVKQINRLLSCSKILDFPTLLTEQYPKGLGHTHKDVNADGVKMRVEKTVFSMVLPETEPVLMEWAKNKPDEFNIILCGIEAHVCVLQTALDLRRRNFNVFTVVDACSSRSVVDRNFGFHRMRDAGCVLTTVEAVLLELLNGSSHPHFKAVQKLILELPADMALSGAGL